MREFLNRIGGGETLLIVALLIGAAIWWYGSYIAPNDAHMHAVMECVEAEGSYSGNRETWERCHNKLIPKAGGLVSVFTPPTH